MTYKKTSIERFPAREVNEMETLISKCLFSHQDKYVCLL